MRSLGRALLFGLFVWLIPFVVAVFIFPLHESHRPLFESIMPVAVTAAAVAFSLLFLTRLETTHHREGILLGILWFVMCVGLDLPMMLWGPMKMSLADYMMDIGLTYLIVPIVTIGMGYALGPKG